MNGLLLLFSELDSATTPSIRSIIEATFVAEWWLNELLSLGVAVHRRNEFNDIKEISNLADNIKRYYYNHSRNSTHYNN